MSPEVTAAWIAAGGVLVTVIVQIVGFRSTKADTTATLEQEREQLDRTLAGQRDQLNETLKAQPSNLAVTSQLSG